jgi:hypothetical protein
MTTIKSARQSPSLADARRSADQFLEPGSEDVDPCDRCRNLPERWALRPASFAPGFHGPSRLTGRHQLGHVVRIDHEFLGRSVMKDLLCLDCPLQRDHLGV